MIAVQRKSFSLAGLLAGTDCDSPVAEKKFPLFVGGVKWVSAISSRVRGNFATSTRTRARVYHCLPVCTMGFMQQYERGEGKIYWGSLREAGRFNLHHYARENARSAKEFCNTKNKQVCITGEFLESIKKGEYSTPALWLCASVDHSSGVSAFALRGWRGFNTVPCSVSAIRSARAILRPLYSGFQPSHTPFEFSSASSRRKRIGLSGEDPTNSSSTGLSSSGSLMAHASCSSAFGLRRCISERATSTRRFISSLALVPIASTCSSASREDSSGFSVAPSVCLLAISPRMAVTINPALLSSGCLTDSIPSITSWGTRTVVNCDLAFLRFAIVVHLFGKTVFHYTGINEVHNILTCTSFNSNVYLIMVLSVPQNHKRQRPTSAVTRAGRLTTIQTTRSKNYG